jgi:glutamine amidotransferase
MQVVIVDTGYGNLRSVERATQAAARELNGTIQVLRSSQPAAIRQADAVIFPGQGAFLDCRKALTEELSATLLEKIKSGAPFLGICIGLQLLFEGSEEAPGCPGLGWFQGDVRRLDGTGVKIPHMGWNQLELHSGGHRALSAAGGAGSWVYFVHSFHALPAESGVLKATVSYGKNQITAAVARDNVLATQFHPEKSQQAGLALLKEFLRG